MAQKTEKIEVRVTTEEKKMIKERADKFGYNTVSAFIIDSAKNHFKIELDLSSYRELAKEVNYIGKNINNIIRHIFTVGIYTKSDLDDIKKNQEKIIELLNNKYKHLMKIRNINESMSIKDKKKIIEMLQKNEIEVPKKILLEEIYERIRNDIVYICEAIENSPLQEEGISDYVYEYLYGKTLFSLEEKKLIEFADKIYFFAEKLKMKLIKSDNYFDDNDWYELKSILDEYEVY